MNMTRTERYRKKTKQKKIILICSLIFIIVLSVYIRIGSWIPYGHSLLTIEEYNGIKQEEKLIRKIVYGYEFTLTDKYYDEKVFVDQNDVGVPKKTITATKILTKRMVDQNGLYIGEMLMGQVYRDFLGDDDIDFEQKSSDIKKDVPNQLEDLNKSAMVDLSNRHIIKNHSKKRTTNIAKHFAQKTGTIR